MRASKLRNRHGYWLMLGLAVCVFETNGCGSGDGSFVDDGGSGPLGGSANKSGAQGLGGTSTSGGSSSAEAGTGGTVSNVAGAAGETSSRGGAPQGGAPSDAGAAGQPVEGGASNGSGGSSAFGGSNNASGGIATSGGASSGSGGTLTGSGGVAGAPTTCVFHTPTQGIPEGGAGGEGGAGPAPTITSQKNGFAGTYLADGNGRALYIYGADAPGDCNNPPITNCFNDCLVAWPPFKGEPRLVGPGLDDSLFGTITRSDGFLQATYRGWPLYYYKSDVVAGDVKGQGVGKIWQLAQIVLPNIEIMRSGSIRFLGDGEGHALYASSADTLGTSTTPPVSACTGSCLDSYPMFAPTYASPVTYLNAADFTYFARGDGKLQLAYKGAPLYRSTADTRSGTMNGVATGWALVAP